MTQGAESTGEARTESFAEAAAAIFARYPRRRNAVLSVLQLAAARGELTQARLPSLAALCEASLADTEGVARAYGLMPPPAQESGGVSLRLCSHVHCTQAGGGEALWAGLRRRLPGSVLLRVEFRRCFGHCSEGPCVEVEGRLLTEVEPAAVLRALSALLERPAADALR